MRMSIDALLDLFFRERQMDRLAHLQSKLESFACRFLASRDVTRRVTKGKERVWAEAVNI
jgi:hypothetical protein